ncbi:LON peptidase N-terminal domain and RING finger protein 3-like [Megalops cyprinoides]|uniref:LON peptidase N-terminal domain and RING finger protein 3-like n=1 Tax=Megalops cyprinoides TaxID=118141 RepID=UPI001864B98A|nr:LON peptidase N-terminal domain and RING finger protein 3-like [Megalops cyprinoides]
MGTEGTESNVMLELAAEAFQAKNFELAAEIYECQLQDFSDLGTQHELLVKRAEALAFGGKLSEAFEVYKRASKINRLRPTQLENLMECLANKIRSKEGLAGQKHPEEGHRCGRNDAFTCRMCVGFLYEPVTLPCGHCFCKKCLDREKRPISCRECKDSSKLTDLPNYRVNVVLSNLLAKWFPSQLHAVQLRHEGNALYAENKLEAALEKYNEAIIIAPRDHLLFSNRSLINSSLKKTEDALADAEMACRLKPFWLKGHLRKAQALTALKKTEEALTEYLLCISLEPESKLAKLEAHKLLSDIFAPILDHVQERIPDCTGLLSSRTRIKGRLMSTLSSNCNTSSLGLYKEGSVNNDSLTSQEKSMIPLAPSAMKETDFTGVKSACCADKCEDEDFCGVCHPTVIDRNHLVKRKHSSEEEAKGGSNGGPCKRLKLEVALKQETTSWSAVVSDLIDAADLECSLCMRLFYEPVTTLCGHTFCLKCLERCLDHNAKCPLCKEDLSEFLAQRRFSKTVLMEHLIAKYLPEELAERRIVNEEEMAELSNLNKNVPIFVCTMAFPTVPCPLHIFEPCYRLMVRRCMETGTKQFGMCLSDSVKGFADYGCILEIRNVEFFADGRSVVDTIGKRRFKVIQHSQRDGYNTADIEYLEDEKVEGTEEAELRTLHDAVYDQAVTWVNSLKAEQKERIVGHFGPMPEKDAEPQISPNGPSWCWWLLAVMPLEGRAQLPFLALTSLRDRLTGIRRVLLFMSRNRSR